MSTEPRDLRRLLEGLGTDLGHTALPGAHAARVRARQRSRRQAAGVAFGAVAVVAVGALVVGGLPTLQTGPEPGPADTPTSPEVPEPTFDDSGLALTVDDLLATYADPELAEAIGWHLGEPPDDPITCAPTPGEADRVIQQWFRTVDDGLLEQTIEISSAEQAQARYQTVIDDVVACVEDQIDADPDNTSLNLIWTVDGIGDATWLGEYYVAPRGPEGELTIVTVSVVLTGDTLTVLTRSGLGMHGHLAGPLPSEIPAAAAGRLCAAAGHDCVGDATPERVYPPVNAETEPGWLTTEDIMTATPDLGRIGEAGDIFDGDEWGHLCLQEANPVAAGAAGVPRRSYHDPLDEAADVPLYEFIAEFDSDQDARSHYLDLVGAMERCQADLSGGVAAGQAEGSAWYVADEFVPFHVGLAVNGSRVAVVEVTVPTWTGGRVTSEQMRSLVDRALQRLGELG